MAKPKTVVNIGADKKAQELREALAAARTKAEGQYLPLEIRMAKIKDRLAAGDYGKLPEGLTDIDEIEKAAGEVETRQSLEYKLLALKKIYDIPWTDNKEYRAASLAYMEYVIPLLAEIEEAKADTRKRIAAMKAAHAKELEVLELELRGQEAIVADTMKACGAFSEYTHCVNFEYVTGVKTKSNIVLDNIKERFRD